MAQAGQILGWIGLSLAVLVFVALVGITFLGQASSSKFSSVGSAVEFSGCDTYYSPDC